MSDFRKGCVIATVVFFGLLIYILIGQIIYRVSWNRAIIDINTRISIAREEARVDTIADMLRRGAILPYPYR